MTHNILHAL